MDNPKAKPDLVARCVSAGSLVLALFALFYARAQGPYYYAQPHQMSYWTVESNKLTEDKLPESGKLTVHIRNESATPARDVLVVVRPLSEKPEIKCSQTHQQQDGVDGSILVKIERIPARSTVEVAVLDQVKEYPPVMSFWSGGCSYKYNASVLAVQTEFGEIKKDFGTCVQRIQYLPADAVFGSDAKF